MISVDTCSDLAGLDSLRERWGQLWSVTPDATFTQTFDWYRAAAESLDAAPRVFVATAAGRMVGLWPTFVRSGGYVCAGIDSPSACLIGPSPAATAAIVARHLARTADRRSLTYAAGGLGAEVGPAFAAAGLFATVTPAAPAGEVNLCGRWADVLDGCDEQTRLSVYRMQHYADDDFRLDRLRPVAGSAVPDAIAAAVGVDGGLASGERRAVAATAAAAVAAGAADVCLLRRGGRVVASSLSFVTAAGVHNRHFAVAAEAPPLAGLRLLREMLRDGLARGDRRFTFVMTPGHPAAEWARPTPRTRVRVEAAGGVGARMRRLGRGLRDACRGTRSAAAV